MTVMLIAVFVLIFCLVLAATKVGFQFVDARQKKQMIDRLHVAAGEPVVGISHLLREIEVDNPHGGRQIQQAGMSFSATHLLLAMGLLCIPGLGLGAAIGLLGNRVLTAIALAVLFGFLPYWYVRRKRKKRLDTLEEQFPE